ncbi:MAG: amidase [Bacteroidota bacterium]
MTFEEYRQYDALGIAQLIKSGDMAAEEILETAIRRIEAVNPTLNAVVHSLFDYGRQMLKEADPEAPFYGVPFLVKDLGIEVAQTPMWAGSFALKGYISPKDSHTASLLRKSGLIFLGKTNTPEFGLTAYTEAKVYDPALNPWHSGHSPGGSSGGAGAAVASGMTPIATASDGGGSIRIPAACCGLFGLKPSRGRNSFGPKYGEMWGGAVAENCLSRSVRDSAAYFEMIQAHFPGELYLKGETHSYQQAIQEAPRTLRIGFSSAHTLGGEVHSDCKKALAHACQLLESCGHIVEEVELPYERNDLIKYFLPVIASETAAAIREIGQLRQQRVKRQELEANTWAMNILGKAYSGAEYAEAKRGWGFLARRMGAFHQKYDILLTPTLATPPIQTGELQNNAVESQLVQWVNRLGSGKLLRQNLDRLADKAFGYIPYTPLSNISGQPSMSVPLYWSEQNGLPIGLLFTAPIGEEICLYQLAAQLEQVQPWKDRWPAES